ncbi:metallophosphoesterase [Undibacterium sp. RTI2.1]|uniref:metallophosphoesterase n=1 Tax=unclassified Undibacterium TaxID=2630295 RepID=UPI002AB42402|nr:MULTISPECIES: metallophosphoesterase [unclassified Undibacterium]MDY7537631.1 metallophosphoesterase [Undibacterium sp. 5I1]MEB0029232.1 metallophosphoesterase [Undibacterium sp. RTI2.1]MEB0115540.1 metallophosphoesterase [Undibacterium sp. RTI2.2]MEB0230176.1 metallophosphoesterase [Undibacterium sp. 10I3]MEB0256368.1 metallophosphoesterase [Undibacterium sp. 5I1]
MTNPVTPKRFLDAFNDPDTFPTLVDVADELGLSVQTVKNRAVLLRQDPSYKNAVIHRGRGSVPMSENLEKITDDWTKEECIEELQRIAKIDPDRVMTRNYFRVNGRIAESVWNQYFGTFEEFRRQAGLVLSRQQHQFERQIAKHVSVDHYRKANDERRNYDVKYLRDKSGRFKTVMICSDLHDIEIDPFYLRVWLDTVARVQPDIIVFNGDIFDLPEFGKYGVDPREWDVVGRIKFAHDKILGPTRAVAPEAQIDFIEGNHEARMLRHLSDETPAMRAVLAELHGWTISKLLGLDQFEINYIAKADLAAFTKRDFEKELAQNYKVYFDTFLCHHFPHARNLKLPGVNGHHHKHIVWSDFTPVYGAFEWHQLGSGHKRAASYCEGEKWHMGFDIAHIDTHTRATMHDYVTVTDMSVSGGKFYHRLPTEIDHAVPKMLLMNGH